MNTQAIYRDLIKGGDKEHGLQVQKEKEVLAEREMLESAKWKQFSSSEIGRELLKKIENRIAFKNEMMDVALRHGLVDTETALLKAMETSTLREVLYLITNGKFEN